jgi:hypothetical protein
MVLGWCLWRRYGTRTCSMPEGTQLFFPVINGIGINAPDVRGQDKKYLTVSQVHVDAAPKLLGQLIYQ